MYRMLRRCPTVHEFARAFLNKYKRDSHSCALARDGTISDNERHAGLLSHSLIIIFCGGKRGNAGILRGNRNDEGNRV